MVKRATVSTVIFLVNMLGLQVIGVKRGSGRGLRSEHAGRNRIGQGQVQLAGYPREDPDTVSEMIDAEKFRAEAASALRGQSLLQKSREQLARISAESSATKTLEVARSAANAKSIVEDENDEVAGAKDSGDGELVAPGESSGTASAAANATPDTQGPIVPQPQGNDPGQQQQVAASVTVPPRDHCHEGDCGRADGFAGCCCGEEEATTSTSTSTFSATAAGNTKKTTTTTTTTTTTPAAGITTTTTPSPLDLDLCFVFDITGSMGAYLAALKQKSTALANDIVNRVREHIPDLPAEQMPRYAVVPYKDFEDHLSPSTILDFTGDLNKLSQHIQPLEVGGGGDTPEDILGALHTATETLSWERPIRFVVVVTDAPGHGPDLNDGGDSTPNPPPPTVEVAMKDLQSQGINLVFVSCNAGATAKTENAMRAHYNNGEREMTSLPLSGAEGFVEKLGDLVVNKLIGEDHM
eukprot:g6197.t1